MPLPGKPDEDKEELGMIISMNQFIQWIENATQRIQENKIYLTELDQAIGDGDHGINLSRGFKEVANKIKVTDYQDIGALFQDIGMVLLSKVGGASGPLYGTAFIKAASVLKGKTEVTVLEWQKSLQESVAGLKMRGKAELGNKTMLDVWEPMAMYIEQNGDELSWQELLAFCKEQMEKTKPLEAKKGRAAYLGPRSVGHYDPGAVSSYLLFESLCLTMIESGDNQ
jgi:dihydroxyacetone kinase-like protein